MIDWNPIHQHAANTIRILSAESIERAKSGHPGLPLGCAEIMHVLWYRYLRHNPANPIWFGRDRFILSAGHGSALLYSMLHLYGYGVTTEDLMNFRQWNSITPGHPERGVTPGVEVSTGPLGAGFATAVGMAIASKNLRATTGLDQADGVRAPRMIVLCGDGCLMEGVSYEAAALAGHLKLDNLFCIYDSNRISIEGSTDLAFTSNVRERFEAEGWRVVEIANANNLKECDDGLHRGLLESDGRPTLIIAHTQIGFGSPGKQGSEKSHGEPLGEQEILKTRENLGFPAVRSFEVEADVAKLFKDHVSALVSGAEKWDNAFNAWKENHQEGAALIAKFLAPEIPADLYEKMIKVLEGYKGKSVATRQAGGDVLQVIAEALPNLIGGAADLAPSTKTFIKNATDFTPDNRKGRNIHFGVREFAMGLAGNGMATYRTHRPFTSTFFVFSDYMKPAIRLAAMQQIPHTFIFTHDSFHVGEDGPTHQPIEQLTMLRTIPGLNVFRPADAFETAAAWDYIIRSAHPSALILTRQNIPVVTAPEGLDVKVAQGAYVVDDEADFDTILIATGSEVSLALDAAKPLRDAGRKVRVVSMPSMERFNAQTEEYRESVIPTQCCCIKRVSIEAGCTMPWYKYVGNKGLTIGLNDFGYSAPASVIAEKLGFTTHAISARILQWIESTQKA